ncbi:hypothetical protein F4778DRAFT_720450 [Xylariomycetidae sp. FL2044]|nr:hypothetical protein F4778DRAFT_720450 [Xylariomycetidae sp. FL2044]
MMMMMMLLLLLLLLSPPSSQRLATLPAPVLPIKTPILPCLELCNVVVVVVVVVQFCEAALCYPYASNVISFFFFFR